MRLEEAIAIPEQRRLYILLTMSAMVPIAKQCAFEEHSIQTISAVTILTWQHVASFCIRFSKEGILVAVSTNENGVKILANTDGPRLLRSVESCAFDPSTVGPAWAVKATGENYSVEPGESPRPFHALLDVGLLRTTTGNRVFGALKVLSTPGQQDKIFLCGQIGHFASNCQGNAKRKAGEFDETTEIDISYNFNHIPQSYSHYRHRCKNVPKTSTLKYQDIKQDPYMDARRPLNYIFKYLFGTESKAFTGKRRD